MGEGDAGLRGDGSGPRAATERHGAGDSARPEALHSAAADCAAWRKGRRVKGMRGCRGGGSGPRAATERHGADISAAPKALHPTAADRAAWREGRRVKGGAERACSNSKREWTSQPRAASFGWEAWASQRMRSCVQAGRGEACGRLRSPIVSWHLPLAHGVRAGVVAACVCALAIPECTFRANGKRDDTISNLSLPPLHLVWPTRRS